MTTQVPSTLHHAARERISNGIIRTAFQQPAVSLTARVLGLSPSTHQHLLVWDCNKSPQYRRMAAGILGGVESVRTELDEEITWTA